MIKSTTLNLQTKLTGHVLIRKGNDTIEIPACFVYGNKEGKGSMIMMLQDKDDA